MNLFINLAIFWILSLLITLIGKFLRHNQGQTAGQRACLLFASLIFNLTMALLKLFSGNDHQYADHLIIDLVNSLMA